MKSDCQQTPISVDRLATSEEIRAAISLCSDATEEYVATPVWDIAADLGGYVRIPSLEIETIRLVEELLEDNGPWTN